MEEEKSRSRKKGSGEGKRVLVTGGNGFIGTWLVQRLLSNLYTVSATYQPGTTTAHLLSLPNVDLTHANLSLFSADLLDPDAILAAAKGCGDGVFHVASPCTLEDPEDPELELILPAVQGTVNVLDAARKVGARRVVVTSSISAMVPNPTWMEMEKVVDEDCWTDVEYCRDMKKWYPMSKTAAERTAWGYSAKHGIDIVTIHPSACVGPLLQPGLNASSAVILQLLQGSQDTQEYHWLGCVDVRDVADAHILLSESEEANGRYLCTNGIFQFRDFAHTVATLFPSFPVHRFSEETQPGLVSCKNAAKRLIDLGVVFTPVEDAIKDSVASMMTRGIILDQ